ncbi:hypothetical protein AAMO2058_001517600 [Amorphochlora amoebiformis]
MRGKYSSKAPMNKLFQEIEQLIQDFTIPKHSRESLRRAIIGKQTPAKNVSGKKVDLDRFKMWLLEDRERITKDPDFVFCEVKTSPSDSNKAPKGSPSAPSTAQPTSPLVSRTQQQKYHQRTIFVKVLDLLSKALKDEAKRKNYKNLRMSIEKELGDGFENISPYKLTSKIQEVLYTHKFYILSKFGAKELHERLCYASGELSVHHLYDILRDKEELAEEFECRVSFIPSTHITENDSLKQLLYNQVETLKIMQDSLCDRLSRYLLLGASLFLMANCLVAR